MPHNPYPLSSAWPPLTSAYHDEYGRIDPDVYAAAGKLWPTAQNKLRRSQVDLEEGLILMFRAVAQVTQMIGKRSKEIENLGGYIWVTFSRLMVQEIETRTLHSELDAKYAARFAPTTSRSEDEIINIIQINEIRDRADEWLREVLEFYLLGHTFEEIADLMGGRANRIRSKFSKKMKKLAKQVRGEKV